MILFTIFILAGGLLLVGGILNDSVGYCILGGASLLFGGCGIIAALIVKKTRRQNDAVAGKEQGAAVLGDRIEVPVVESDQNNDDVESELSETGIYIVNSGKLTPLNVCPGKGSINDISESLGIPKEKVHSVITNDSDKISHIVFIRHTQTPLFIITNDGDIRLTYREVLEEITKIDWAVENRQLVWEDKNQ